MFFKKKTERESLLENKHKIEDMASSIDVLISLSKDNDELTNILKDAQDKIKYFNPTQNKEALDFDKKITNRLGDLKIEINKAKSNEDFSKPISSALDLRDSLVAERISKSIRRN